MDPRNKVALVTGGGIGLGKAISLKLAAAGSKIAVAYLSSPKNANETVAKIEAIGGQAMAVHADVSSSDDVRSMVDSVVEQFGRIDILVNNAATRVIVPFSDLDALKEEDWDRIIAVNLRGPFLCAKAVAPAMELRGAGKIINVTSIGGIRPGRKLISVLGIESRRGDAGEVPGGRSIAGDTGQQYCAWVDGYRGRPPLGRGMVAELHRRRTIEKDARGGRRARRSFVFRAQRFCYRPDRSCRCGGFDILTSCQARSNELVDQMDRLKLYVATDGDDGWSGKLAAPNLGETDGPFATLARARDAIRELIAEGGLDSPVTVLVRGGKYYLDKTLVFGAQDSGNRDHPISYSAYAGETPVLSGGAKLDGWQPHKGRILKCRFSKAKRDLWKYRAALFQGPPAG